MGSAARSPGAIRAAGGTCCPFVCDVADEGAVHALHADVQEELGPCAILVNNAAELHRARFATGWGCIVNVASSSLFTSTPALAAFMASKGVVVGLTSALANDVGELGITVNAVSPGLTRTPRAGLPQDLVGVVCFLASDAASFMTGQLLVVDGGMTRR